MVAGCVPPGENKKRLMYESRLHIWDPPYLFRVCSDELLRICVPVEEGMQIIQKCHSSEVIMEFSILMQKFGRVVSSSQACMKTPKILAEDVGHVRGTKITLLEMLCHSPTIFRWSSLMFGGTDYMGPFCEIMEL